ncbi:hypothetical protein BBW65_05870 [Helicobacter enhydrae]|uniref:Uncharacterized protein n=1 Tax=Helicobacter enhydrae TaxID=222136 RepID=A0A1B1U7Q0_9HELI|nr:hypothetical protein BBW65_05870 [Helicobacter enhydrae]
MYRDPLFGIAILLGIIALVVLLDYGRNIYRKKQKEKSLQDLVKSYEHNGFRDEIGDLLKVSHNPLPALVFLAKSYANRGENQQAITIYLTLLDRLEDFAEKIEILEELGHLYYQAGFLQQAKNIYIELLKNAPRHSHALIALVRVYETLGDYKEAMEVLECFDELNEALSNEDRAKLRLARLYLQTLIVINDALMPFAEKRERLCEVMQQESKLSKVILGYLKFYDLPLFWEMISTNEVDQVIDLLWDFQKEQVPFDAISGSQICEVFEAKGYLEGRGCSHFALETIRLFGRYSSQSVQPTFMYVCLECQTKIPFDSFRCPNCGELGEMRLIVNPQKCDEAS